MNPILAAWLRDAIGETHNVTDLIAEIDAADINEPDPRAYMRSQGMQYLRTYTVDDTLPELGIDPVRLAEKYGDDAPMTLLGIIVDNIENALFGPHAGDLVDYTDARTAAFDATHMNYAYAITDDTPIAPWFDEIKDAGSDLDRYVKPLPPYTEAYRINDFGDYVTVEDWNRVWSQHPAWFERAWMLMDNGQYTSDEVRRMTLGEVEAHYGSDDFDPMNAYLTDTGEDGVE